ncbi:transferase hexapeptide (six repeat-containing protein) [Natronincola peptidivorans]|uniref:Transferase hexapeptide (Six repeat-containing protein) n=1 Tax=Natronincola peptidivorans TaxID=426128 RepID=A0A1H9ZSG6_9FIRM|nr:DapH/DapD/GlmU-related protein [Natronincola peptidivorans]SES84728.1 transferase hexapeptide (six repeat-containing protein) [Natronincola peptidivorans]
MIYETARLYTKNLGENLVVKDYSIIYENTFIMDDVTIGEHCVIGRQTTTTAAVVRAYNEKEKVFIGSNTAICCNVTIYTGVTIGEEVLLGDNVSIMPEVKIGNKVLISRNVTINSEVEIGDSTRIMDNSHVTGRVKIGKNVFISVGVIMANDNSFGKFGFNDDVKGPTIEDNVAIGVGAILLPSIKIGKGSIIAAGSVVKDNIPENVIAAGNPASVVTRVPKHLRR